MQLCERHYYRQRAHGSFDNPRQRQAFYVDAQGYHRVTAPDHPLAKGNSGTVLQHRLIFYDEHGPGPFNCHWCSKHIEWETMHVDHVNFVRNDNRLENLVASCPLCNTARSYPKSLATNTERYAVKLTYNGETLPLRDWASRLGIAKESLKWRLASGWTVARAVTAPRGQFGPRSAR